MLEESMALLLPAGDGRQPVFVDATFGAGGYTRVVKRTKRGTNDARKLAYITFV